MERGKIIIERGIWRVIQAGGKDASGKWRGFQLQRRSGTGRYHDHTFRVDEREILSLFWSKFGEKIQ